MMEKERGIDMVDGGEKWRASGEELFEDYGGDGRSLYNPVCDDGRQDLVKQQDNETCIMYVKSGLALIQILVVSSSVCLYCRAKPKCSKCLLSSKHYCILALQSSMDVHTVN